MPFISAPNAPDRLADSLQFLENQLYEARLGTLYLFSNLKVSGGYVDDILSVLTTGVPLAVDKFGATAAAAAAAAFKPASTAVSGGPAVGRIEDPNRRITPSGETQANTLLAVIEAQVAKIWQSVKNFVCDIARTAGNAGLDLIRDALKQPHELVKQIATIIMSILASPANAVYVAGKTTMQGIVEVFDSAIMTLVTALRAHSASIRKGYAQAIVDGVHVAAAVRGGNGIANIGIGLLTLPLSAVPAAGPVVKAVLSMVRSAAFLFFRLYESCMLERLSGEARQKLEEGGYMRYGRFSPGAECHNALPHDAKAFDSWFRPYAVCVPSVSSLVLASRVCGSRDVYLNLCVEGGEVLSPAAYASGVDYLGHLAHVAEMYLKNSGLQFDYGKTWLTGHMAKVINPQHRVGPPADKYADVPAAVRQAYTATDRSTVAWGVWRGIGHIHAQNFRKWRGK